MNGKNRQKTDLLLKYTDYIYKCAYRYSGNRMDAEDLAQETFFQAYKKFKQLRDPAKVKSWLFTILRNLFLQNVNSKKKYKYIDVEEYIEQIPDKVEKDDDLEFDFSDEELQLTLNVLDEKYKTPLLMFYFENYSYKDISKALDIPIGTVMSRIARSKVFLRRYLTNNIREKNIKNNVLRFRNEKNG